LSATSRRFWRFIPALTGVYWLGILTLTHLPPSELPKTHVSDKLAHFVVFALLAVFLCLSLWNKMRSPPMMAIVVLAIGLAYGAFDENTQPIFGRTCSLYDWYADAAGAGTAVVVMGIIRTMSNRSAERAS
jgi:VanZ family protein